MALLSATEAAEGPWGSALLFSLLSLRLGGRPPRAAAEKEMGQAAAGGETAHRARVTFVKPLGAKEGELTGLQNSRGGRCVLGRCRCRGHLSGHVRNMSGAYIDT